MFGSTDQVGAERVDAQSGVQEQVAFAAVGTQDEQILVFAYQPAGGDPSGGVVICPSILGDFLANYRREVQLARSLAAAGLAVFRFHYRGTGNSDGDPGQLTLSSIEDDARCVAEILIDRHPTVPIAFVGTRWGTLSAVAAATEFPSAPLALIEPVTDFARFYDDAIKTRAMSAVVTGDSAESVRQISELLDRHGYADIVGSVISRALYESTAGVAAAELLSAGAEHPRLLVQFGGRDLRAPYRKLEKQFAGHGVQVQTTIVDVAESWWFRPEAPTVDPVAHSFNDALRSWLLAELPKSTRSEQS